MTGRAVIDLIVGRLCRRLDGPTVAFQDPGTASTTVPVPPAGPHPAPGPAAADRSPGSIPGGVGAAPTDRQAGGQGVGFPQAHTSTRPGAGSVANNCVFWLDDPTHECEDWHANPTSRMCRQSELARSVELFERRHPRILTAGSPQ